MQYYKLMIMSSLTSFGNRTAIYKLYSHLPDFFCYLSVPFINIYLNEALEAYVA